MGLDRDGTLFVEIVNGIRLYDLCFDTPLPGTITVSPEDLMRSKNRPLYYRFLTTLNEIDAIVFRSTYDKDCSFRKGDVVVDAGARVGTFAAKISAAVGDEGRIIAIEPEPHNYECLLKNIEANRLRNVTAIQKMLWSRTERRDLYLSRYLAAHSAYLDEFYTSSGDAIRVEADCLDNILEALHIDAVDFIKMDIEGSEIEALKGMKKILKSSVQLAIAAYHPVEGTPSHTIIVPQLEALGFRTSYTVDGIVQAKRQAEASTNAG